MTEKIFTGSLGFSGEVAHRGPDSKAPVTFNLYSRLRKEKKKVSGETHRNLEGEKALAKAWG